jgi:16S rRNA (uracil1498-N3)-methyltransferase
MDQPVPGPRLVVPSLPAAGTECRISGEEAAHARARRLAAGDAVVLVDGSGREALGHIQRVRRADLDVAVESVRASEGGAPAPIHLLVAAVRSERLSWIAEKATELGAARLTIVASQRTQSFRAGESLVPRLSRVVREAVKQCEAARWPEIAGPVALDEVLSTEASAVRLVLDPSGEPFPLALAARPTALLIGPEGGWTEDELAAALEAGWIAASLAAGKLRAETAAIAALTLARTAMARPPAGRND